MCLLFQWLISQLIHSVQRAKRIIVFNFKLPLFQIRFHGEIKLCNYIVSYGHLKKLVYSVSNKLKYVFDSTLTAIGLCTPVEKDNIYCFSEEAFRLNGFQWHELCFVSIHCIIKQEKIMKETKSDSYFAHTLLTYKVVDRTKWKRSGTSFWTMYM